MKIVFAIVLFITPVMLLSQNRFDIVIDEIMADPTPQVALPGVEWLELKNNSANPVNLQNWRIADAASQSGALPSFVLQPDSLVIVCSSSSLTQLASFGAAISVTSFPSLDNDGDQLSLKSPTGKIIHAVNYSVNWYKNDLKKDGGWTLEMIDTKNPCTGMANWKASANSAGGSPGKKNSVDGINADTQAPRLTRAYTTDSLTIVLVYDEQVDSLSASIVSNYSISDNLHITSTSAIPPLFNLTQLKLSSPMSYNVVYTITASGIKDCAGNKMSENSMARVGLPSDPAQGKWILNEILFDPKPSGYDFIEFYNNSRGVLDASRLFIANRNNTGAISSIKPLSVQPFQVFPGDYLVVTEDPENLALQYFVKNTNQVLAVNSLPSFPNDEGIVVTLDAQGNTIDELHYKSDWHFKLISNAEGIALERIDPAEATQNPANWHSASSSSGYATPAAKNSQYKIIQPIDGKVDISPAIFSPDNDGRDDIASIQYELESPGYVANVIIYDHSGQLVRKLVQQGLAGIKGKWNWDGLDDKGNPLPIGQYIVLTELFNLDGKKSLFKNAVVLARSIN